MKPRNDFSAAKSGATYADSVASVMERRIYKGQLKSGGGFPTERELSEEFGVSRTVAREAVKILGGKGLIDARPRHRPVVLQPNYEMAAGVLGNLVNHLIERSEGVEYLFGIRIFVEAGLVRMAATDARKEDIANLREALARNAACVADSERFYETDMAFHSALYTVPDNPIFPALHRSFCDWLADHWKRMPRLPERNKRNYAAHEAILKAILDRNPDEAEAVLRRHLDDAWAQVRQTFGIEKKRDDGSAEVVSP